MSTELKQRTVKVVLFQGDDLERVQELEEAVTQAITNAPAKPEGVRRMNEVPVENEVPGKAEAEARDEFVAEATKRAVVLVVRPLGRKKWRELLNAHPPRDGNEQDKELGFDEEGLADALVPASIGSPVFASADERDDFLDSLSHGQYQRVYSEAWRLNSSFGPSPLLGLSTRLARIYAETSESSDGSASA